MLSDDPDPCLPKKKNVCFPTCACLHFFLQPFPFGNVSNILNERLQATKTSGEEVGLGWKDPCFFVVEQILLVSFQWSLSLGMVS